MYKGSLLALVLSFAVIGCNDDRSSDSPGDVPADASDVLNDDTAGTSDEWLALMERGDRLRADAAEIVCECDESCACGGECREFGNYSYVTRVFLACWETAPPGGVIYAELSALMDDFEGRIDACMRPAETCLDSWACLTDIPPLSEETADHFTLCAQNNP